jgi:hypothetical protein
VEPIKRQVVQKLNAATLIDRCVSSTADCCWK